MSSKDIVIGIIIGGVIGYLIAKLFKPEEKRVVEEYKPEYKEHICRW
jgi:gas vesicle protein